MIVLDEDARLLLAQHRTEGTYEIPGGGWDEHETWKQCLDREAREELGVEIASIDEQLAFMHRARHSLGHVTLRLYFPVVLASHDFRFSSDYEMGGAQFATRDEFLHVLPMSPDEGNIQVLADHIWTPS